jgi:anaerobic magnesium-protoporphyrin IX monomethyl ester cyclase
MNDLQKQMSKTDIALVLTNTRWYGKRPWVIMPLTIAILTTILKEAGIDFTLVDANLYNYDEQMLTKELSSLNPKIIMVSSSSIEYYQCSDRTIKIAKQACPAATTILGGIYPTVLPQEAMKSSSLDYAFLGPAEERLPFFLDLLIHNNIKKAMEQPGIGYHDEKQQSVINPINFTDKLKAIDPDYSYIDINGYLTQKTYSHYHYVKFAEPTVILLTSYGCSYNCCFCASASIRGRRVSYRDPEHVLEEIDFFYNQYNIRHFAIQDELFLANKKRVKIILQGIIDRKYKITWKQVNGSVWHLDNEILELMKKSGCKILFISVESGSQRVLKDIIGKPIDLSLVPSVVKKCNNIGLWISANFVIGFPGETWDEIRQTFKLAENLTLDCASFTIATPLPKTELYDICVKENLLPSSFDFTDPQYIGYGKGLISTDQFTPNELMILRAFEWDRINFSSPEKCRVFADVHNMTLEEVEEQRRQTRRKIGLYYQELDA